MPAMIVSHNERRHEIHFDVQLDSDDLLQQIAFVYLVSARFGPATKTVGPRSMRGDGKLYGSILVKFDDYELWDGARSHCFGHLDSDGAIHSNYVGALSYADPEYVKSRKLRDMVLKAGLV